MLDILESGTVLREFPVLSLCFRRHIGFPLIRTLRSAVAGMFLCPPIVIVLTTCSHVFQFNEFAFIKRKHVTLIGQTLFTAIFN